MGSLAAGEGVAVGALLGWGLLLLLWVGLLLLGRRRLLCLLLIVRVIRWLLLVWRRHMLRRRVTMPVIDGTLVPAGGEFLRVPAVERVDAVRADLALESARLMRRGVGVTCWAVGRLWWALR